MNKITNILKMCIPGMAHNTPRSRVIKRLRRKWGKNARRQSHTNSLGVFYLVFTSAWYTRS
jgi:hypothetical protein